MPRLCAGPPRATSPDQVHRTTSSLGSQCQTPGLHGHCRLSLPTPVDRLAVGSTDWRVGRVKSRGARAQRGCGRSAATRSTTGPARPSTGRLLPRSSRSNYAPCISPVLHRPVEPAISSADFNSSLPRGDGALQHRSSHPRKGLNHGARRGRRRRIGQIPWPSAGSFVAVSGQFLAAADRCQLLPSPRTLTMSE